MHLSRKLCAVLILAVLLVCLAVQAALAESVTLARAGAHGPEIGIISVADTSPDIAFQIRDKVLFEPPVASCPNQFGRDCAASRSASVRLCWVAQTNELAKAEPSFPKECSASGCTGDIEYLPVASACRAASLCACASVAKIDTYSLEASALALGAPSSEPCGGTTLAGCFRSAKCNGGQGAVDAGIYWNIPTSLL